jgi:LuxR family maltose regulon positive regulatory protein
MASALRWQGDLAAAARVSAEIIDLSRAVGENQVAAEAHCIQSGTQILQGRLHDAAASCREAIRLGDESFQRSRRTLPVTSLAYARLGLLSLEWDDINSATHYAREGVRKAERWGTADMLLVSYREMAHVLQAGGDAAGALDAIEKGMRLARGMSLWLRADMAAERAKLWLAQGNLPAAQRWAAESGLTRHDRVPFHREKEYRILAQTFMAQGKGNQALELLVPLADMLASLQAAHSLIAALVLQALALQMQGAVEQALDALGRALALAEPGGYVRTFVDEGEPMARLLRQAMTRAIAPGYVARLLAAFRDSAPPRPPVAQALVEPLTGRELEVLRLIAAGLSNREIAQELFIALSTVKTHVNRIYGKLNAKSRTQAVLKAQALDLL